MVSASSPMSTASATNGVPASLRARRSMDGISRRQGGHQVAQKLTRTTLPLKQTKTSNRPTRTFRASTGAGAFAAGSVRLWDKAGRSAAKGVMPTVMSRAPIMLLNFIRTPHIFECCFAPCVTCAPVDDQVEAAAARKLVGGHALIPVPRVKSLGRGKLSPGKCDAGRLGDTAVDPGRIPFSLAAEGASLAVAGDVAPVGQAVFDRKGADIADDRHEDAAGRIVFRLFRGEAARLIEGPRLIGADLRQPNLDAACLDLPAFQAGFRIAARLGRPSGNRPDRQSAEENQQVPDTALFQSVACLEHRCLPDQVGSSNQAEIVLAPWKSSSLRLPSNAFAMAGKPWSTQPDAAIARGSVSVGCPYLTSVSLSADSWIASHAARLSDVTDQICGSSAACRHSSAGIQTGVNPCLNAWPMFPRLSAGTRLGFRSHSIRPYCSLARMAMWCAAASLIPVCVWTVRTTSAKGPPPGTSTVSPPAAASASRHWASSGTRYRLPPSFTTRSIVRLPDGLRIPASVSTWPMPCRGKPDIRRLRGNRRPGHHLPSNAANDPS